MYREKEFDGLYAELEGIVAGERRRLPTDANIHEDSVKTDIAVVDYGDEVTRSQGPEGSTEVSPSSPPRIALLFTIIDEFPNELLWRVWLNGHESQFELYFHAKVQFFSFTLGPLSPYPVPDSMLVVCSWSM